MTSAYTILYYVEGAGGLYVGITNDLQRRWREHGKDGRCGSRLLRAIRAHGREAFSIREVCRFKDRAVAKGVEARLISHFRNEGIKLFNLTAGGDGRDLQTEETKRKVSESLIGNRRSVGRKHSEETRAKMSAARRGRKTSPETRARMSAAQLGNKRRLGQKNSPEHCAKIAAGNRGKRSARKGTICSDETRQRMRDAWVLRRAKKDLAPT